MINWEAKKLGYKTLKRVSLRNYVIKLIDFFEPYCKNENDHKELEKVIEQFIRECDWKDSKQIYHLYRSITTRDRTFRATRNIKKINSDETARENWGRTRIWNNYWTDEKVIIKERTEKRARKQK